jgi:mono/diheme cytochrome c family protein
MYYLFVLFLTIAVSFNFAQSKKNQRREVVHQHKEYQGIKNPVVKTPKNLYEGKVLYEKNCTSCHGNKGKADTAMGKSLNPKAADFTDNIWKHGSSDGEIFNVISKGIPKTGMAGWKEKLSEEEIWKILNFLKLFQEMDKTLYICPMHPEVTANLPDKCSKCGMYLEKLEKKEK